MEKTTQAEILNLEFVRLKIIINKLYNSSNKDLTQEELVLYIDNLNQIISLSTQINKSLRECKKRADTALKASRNVRLKSQLSADPEYRELQEKLAIMYNKALEESDSENS